MSAIWPRRVRICFQLLYIDDAVLRVKRRCVEWVTRLGGIYRRHGEANANKKKGSLVSLSGKIVSLGAWE